MSLLNSRFNFLAELKGLLAKLPTIGFNLINTAVYLVTLGGKTLHEGRYSRRRRRWFNWNRVISFKLSKNQIERPKTEKEIRDTIMDAKDRGVRKIRVVGAGHAFNRATVLARKGSLREPEPCLLSLERYNGVRMSDQTGRVWAQAGIRLRDLTKKLAAWNLALPVLGSADTQTLGGLLATDVHGTGREHGFLSEQVTALRIVNAAGEIEEFRDGSRVFRAALGGLGTCGVITEVELQCVPAFNLAKSSRMMLCAEIEEKLDELVRSNDHVSIYYMAGLELDHAIVNTWNRTAAPVTPRLRLKKMLSELFEMAFSGFALGFVHHIGHNSWKAKKGLQLFRRFEDGMQTVHPAATAFVRKLYFRHDELEYGVPYQNEPDGKTRPHLACWKDIQQYLKEQSFWTVVELRFTPDTSKALLGPGVGRPTCFFGLATSTYHSREKIDRVYKDLEKIILGYGGQPHLGKATYEDNVNGRTMATEIYAAPFKSSGLSRFEVFEEVRKKQDPCGKFMNDFTEQVFGPVQQTARHEPLRVSA